MIRFLFISFLLAGFCGEMPAQTFIKPNDSRIGLTGGLFNKIYDNSVIFRRHSDAFLALPDNIALANDEKAKTTSGISINFKTDATTVTAHFRMLKGANAYWIYATCFIDGNSTAVLKQKRDDLTGNNDSTFTWDISSPGIGVHTYRIVLPNLSTIAFEGLTLTGGNEDLADYKLPDKPLYVAYGNSITHGRGQNTGDQTYPWILSERMGWQLCNIAVGGSKTSVPMAEMIARDIKDKIDYLTILIGYNDAVGYCKDTAYYRKKLIAFVDTVRKGHPETTIFVLGQTYTETTQNKNGDPFNFDDWRRVQKFVVDSLTTAGDSLIHYINGADFTDYDDLNNPPNDVVHLSIDGARSFGNALADTIRQILGIPAEVPEKLFPQAVIHLYPNPAVNNIKVSTGSAESPDIQLYNLLGERLPLKIISSSFAGEIDMDISSLSSGVYILKTKIATGKIVKK